MYIEDYAKEVAVIFDDSGAEAILKKMPTALMALIESARVARAQACHESREGYRPGLEHQVHVIRQERPRVAEKAELRNQSIEPFSEVLAIHVVAEDLPAFNAADHHVLGGAGRVHTRPTRHFQSLRGTWVSGRLG
jgi:hypothetical protein